MSMIDEGGYSRFRKLVGATAAAAVIGGMLVGSTLAAGDYGEPQKIPAGSGYGASDYSFNASTVAVPYGGGLYQYATGKDGAGYYSVYGGDAWSDWTAWQSQPATYWDEPTAVAYKDSTYVYYAGTDKKLYANSYDGSAWSGWNDLAGGKEIKCSPYVYVNGDYQYLSATAEDGAVYTKTYDGTNWSDWYQLSGDVGSDYQPYGLAWGDYQQIFWHGTDGSIYWARYDGSAWSEPKALPGDYQLDAAPYAGGMATISMPTG